MEIHKYKINYDEDKKKWDKFVSESNERSIFIMSKFIDSLNIKYNLVTCYDGDKIIAGAPIIFFDNNPIISAFHFTQFQGLVLDKDLENQPHSIISHRYEVIKNFIEILLNKYEQLCLSQSWRFNDLRPFQWYNYIKPEKGQFKIDLRYTGILNLQNYLSFDEYFFSVRKARKQEYKKNSKLLKIVRSDNVEVLDILHNKTFQRHGINKSELESSLVRSIAEKALLGNYGDLRLAMLEEKPIAAVLFLYDDRTAYYLFGATDPEFRQYTPNSVILHDIIKDIFESKIREIDFVGINSPNRGDYKISFNADLKPYFICSFIKK